MKQSDLSIAAIRALKQKNEQDIINTSLVDLRDSTKKIITHIISFIHQSIDHNICNSLQYFAYDNRTLQLNDGPYYSPITQRIFLPLECGDLGYNRISFSQEIFIIAHETCHHIQSVLDIYNQMKDIDDFEFKLGRESQADYFAGIFLCYCVELGLLNMSDIDEIQNFIYELGTFSEEEHVNNMIEEEELKNNFVCLNNDYHGTGGHRLEMFLQGYDSQDWKNFEDFEYFIPEHITEIRYSTSPIGDDVEADLDAIKELIIQGE